MKTPHHVHLDTHDHEHPHGHDDAHGHSHGNTNGHSHGHSQTHGGAGHSHSHDHRSIGRSKLQLVLILTAAFMVVELVAGLLSNSLTLLADAGHMLSDVGAIALSMLALWFAKRPATQHKSYGYHRFEILAAFVNGMALVIIGLLILWEAYNRILSPQPVTGGLMLTVGAIGLVINITCAFILHGSADHNLNMRGAYLHVISDMLGSIGAIGGAIVIMVTGWTPADPIISAVVSLLILGSSWRLVRESVDILLEAVPSHIDLAAVHNAICSIDGVEEVHDLHVWTLTSGFLAMSGHALITDPTNYMQILQNIHTRMHEQFGIEHVTVQIEHQTLYPLRREGR